MKNKLVSIGYFLFQGIMYVVNPLGGLRRDAGMLAGLIALYSLISMAFVLTNNNQTVGKGKKLAGNLIKGNIESKKDPVVQGRELFSKNNIIDEKAKETSSKWDNRLQSLSEKQKQKPKAGKVMWY